MFARTFPGGQPPVGWGNDTITDFEHGLDHLNMTGTGLSFPDLSISQQGANTLIADPASGSSILLLNHNAATFSASDFYF
jgi:hypothetical protein